MVLTVPERKVSIYVPADPAQTSLCVALAPLSSFQAEAVSRDGTTSSAAHPAAAGFLTVNRLLQGVDLVCGLSSCDPTSHERRRAAACNTAFCCLHAAPPRFWVLLGPTQAVLLGRVGCRLVGVHAAKIVSSL